MTISLSDFDLDLHFSSGIYRSNLPQYLNMMRPIASEYVAAMLELRPRDPIYPSTMTSVMQFDDRVKGFRDDILNLAWQVLDSQGYFMDPYLTTCSSMWTQSHPEMAGMEYHVHGDGNQLNAFYFLEATSDSMHMIVHDPRPAKTIINLPLKQTSDLTMGHGMVYYTPKPGDLFITNSWLPHSFTRNRSKSEVNFIHMNINVIPNPNYQPMCASEPIIV